MNELKQCLMCNFRKGEKMSKNIRYTHPNGYTGILYGKSSLAVQNSEGREVFHTGFRNINTLDELKKWLDDFPKFMEMLNPYWGDNDD